MASLSRFEHRYLALFTPKYFVKAASKFALMDQKRHLPWLHPEVITRNQPISRIQRLSAGTDAFQFSVSLLFMERAGWREYHRAKRLAASVQKKTGVFVSNDGISRRPNFLVTTSYAASFSCSNVPRTFEFSESLLVPSSKRSTNE